MNEVWSAAWRGYPAAGLLLVGAALIAAGLQAGFGRREAWRGGPATALTYLFMFRRLAAGLAAAAFAVGWLEQVPWLLAASVCIGLGELLETSYYIMVVRWGQRHDLVPRVPPGASHPRVCPVPSHPQVSPAPAHKSA